MTLKLIKNLIILSVIALLSANVPLPLYGMIFGSPAILITVILTGIFFNKELR